MYQALLRDSTFFEFLLKCDADLAEIVRREGCECGGKLHRASYDRKPRGGPEGGGRDMTIRFSFCCAQEGCRQRATPPSLRFLGRKVFFGALVLLLPILREGPTPMRMERLCEVFSISVRTVNRWRRFWRGAFVSSDVWQGLRSRFAQPVSASNMPGSLLAAFSKIDSMADRVVAVLRFVSPISQIS